MYVIYRTHPVSQYVAPGTAYVGQYKVPATANEVHFMAPSTDYVEQYVPHIVLPIYTHNMCFQVLTIWENMWCHVLTM